MTARRSAPHQARDQAATEESREHLARRGLIHPEVRSHFRQRNPGSPTRRQRQQERLLLHRETRALRAGLDRTVERTERVPDPGQQGVVCSGHGAKGYSIGGGRRPFSAAEDQPLCRCRALVEKVAVGNGR